MSGELLVFLFIALLLSLPYLQSHLSSVFYSKKHREQESKLLAHFEYYTLLNEIERKKFLKRVNKFIRRTKFYGRKGFEITDDVKLLISASAVQLTFGFYNFKFSIFRTILVYPDEYKNAFTGNYHKGELNPKGLIVYSWRHFLEGYYDNDDNINLGLHEMAHALFYTLLKTNDLDYDLDNYLSNYVKLSANEIRKIRNGEIHFFRKYAGQNLQEFFAVSVEHFFESPSAFKAQLPRLYKYLSILLNQDPANRRFFLREKPSIFSNYNLLLNFNTKRNGVQT